MNKQNPDTDTLKNWVIEGIKEKKGKNIVVLDLRKMKEAVTDYFIICHGDSTTQVKAIAESVDEEVHKALGVRAWQIEGRENASWVLVDYGDVVAHVFLRDIREFYNLEDLWNDAPHILVES